MSIISTSVIVFLSTCLLLFALWPAAKTLRLIDYPYGRHQHKGAIPLTGGIAMFVGTFIGASMLDTALQPSWPIIAAAAILIVGGAVDDRFGLSAAVRLAGQSLAVLLATVGGGMLMTDIGAPVFVGTVTLGVAAVPFTVLVTLTVINAFNMLDGVDGLAGGTAVIVLSFLALAAWIGTAADAFSMSLVLIASVAGFLIFNFPLRKPNGRRSFMGDAGSTFLGFSITFLTISLCQGSDRAMTPATGLWIVALPLFDIYSSFFRRLLRGASPLKADREHFHHVLLRAGLSITTVLAVLLSSSVFFGAIGLIGYQTGASEGLMIFGLAMMGIVYSWLIRRSPDLVSRFRSRFSIPSGDYPS